LGKPYEKELQNLDLTYSLAIETSIENVTSFIHSSLDLPMLAIGSGGSMTAANFLSILHQQTGNISKYLTPLEFVSMETSIHDLSIVFLTAGGRNSDIIKSFKVAVNAEPLNLMTFCTTKSSPLSRLTNEIHYANLYEIDLPSGKDGFLATNSLLAMMIIITRGYLNILNHSIKFPSSLTELVHPEKTRKDFIMDNIKNAEALLKKDTLIVLYGKWGKAAAIDIESKFTEAGLGNVLISDYRNFGHGRHNWLDKQKSRTGVIGLITPDDLEIADKTLNLIPKDIPIIRFSTDNSGPIGSLSLLIKIMYLVKIFGDSKGIDPGRPKVPDFGKRIYHIRMSIPKNKQNFFGKTTINETTAISRKIKHNHIIISDINELKLWKKNHHNFIKRLENEQFGAVVFDYDGTICDLDNRFIGISQEIGNELERLLKNEIIIGIATGRGKSVRHDLQKAINEKYWSKVLIGYYNGSDIGLLNDNSLPDKNIDMDNSLNSISNILKNNQIFKQIAICESRPKQLTIEPLGVSSLKEIRYILESIIQKSGIDGIKILESSHSLDVLAPDISKLNLVRATDSLVKEFDGLPYILCIVDKG
jgi:fructoselysine-6-P-deglycase FrlB-like protein